MKVNVEPTPTWRFTQIRPAVDLDELPGERQPEPRALDLLVGRPSRQSLGDPVMHSGADVDPAPLEGELQGVGQEIHEHLLDLSLVREAPPAARRSRVPA